MTFPQGPVTWALVVVALVAVGAVLRARATNVKLRRHHAELRQERDALLHQRDELHVVHNGLLQRQSTELAEVRKDAEEETKAVLKAAVRTLQGLADEQQVVIEKAQRKYGDDPGILADLMAMDHANSQFGRRAQGIAVLCGGWLGRRETVASVFDVARSAQGRIRHFDRVRVNGQVNFSVVSRAVEPVAVVLAELLANATNYSAPGTPVEINIQAVPTGVCLIVDDAGLGMGQEEKDRAAALLSPQAAISVSSLGIPPQFGFAVSGMLAARYGFRVSVDSVSPYGGVRAVVLIPDELLTTEAPPAAPAEAPETALPQTPQVQPVRQPEQWQAPAPAPTPLFPPAQQPDTATQPLAQITTTAGGLPKRRRKSPVSAVPSAEPEPVRSNEETASRLGAFQRGTRSGRDTTTTEGTEFQ
ncbi:ATP-binding protein [Streptomyces griseus]|uniref:histidine kinase n=1 Tax=Streptomyces griseus subsp. griseus (strain JCM 4626 / CBS 651.72 / NBRC 13350 / KCC S-0626 / ISP 5235) TaxID=455632 RepID=B1VMK9_STRGG|nr:MULTISPECIES: ATP-binding protein [Streptomyces]MYR51122.1 ATP-binding protein [Streptomyces sp. SID4928]BAG20319.1 putative sensor-like histidine kinase [Streptomyces griseus subsp. griseus NBRC 13350]SQA23132.1 ATP-binding region ATPase domain protein [Streptomyces griseus]